MPTATAKKSTKKTGRRAPAKKAVARKATTTTGRTKIAATQRGGTAKPCKHCGQPMHARNIDRHIRAKHPEHYTGPTIVTTARKTVDPDTVDVTTKAGKTIRTRIVESYLADVRQGNTHKPTVNIGGIPGFTHGPKTTEDPAEIEAAIKALEAAAANEPKPTKELKLRQRLRDMRLANDRLNLNGNSTESLFIRFAAGYAQNEKPPISFEAFREFGVDARVLKEAGIH